MTSRATAAGEAQQSSGSVPAVEAIDLTKTLPLDSLRIPILKGISLRIDRGEIVAILGPSGSGKSTLLGIIAGLDQPTTGRILIDGTDITRMSESRLAGTRNRKIGMVFQMYNLIPTLTAQENVEVPLYIGKRGIAPARAAAEMLGLVGMSHRAGNRPVQLSGGEQQRVAIARALVTHPALVIMDEPTGNLDRSNGDTVLALIQDLRERTGTTFVIASHDPVVAHAADRIISLVDGQLAA
jgi:putative ABC transport system ATP-binding protein